MNKALFLDRDGVINDNSVFVNSAEDLKFIHGVFDFCRNAKGKGYKLIIVTNQGGIAANHITDEAHHAIQEAIYDKFDEEECPLTDYLYCPHLPPNHHGLINLPNVRKDLIFDCGCRKPKAGMFYNAQKKHNIDLQNSWMIGDNETDMQAGIAAGLSRDNVFLFNPEECVWPTL